MSYLFCNHWFFNYLHNNNVFKASKGKYSTASSEFSKYYKNRYLNSMFSLDALVISGACMHNWCLLLSFFAIPNLAILFSSILHFSWFPYWQKGQGTQKWLICFCFVFFNTDNGSPKYAQLNVVATLQSVCESIVYGTPLYLRPTTRLDLDWDEHTGYHQQFVALLSSLEKLVSRMSWEGMGVYLLKLLCYKNVYFL